MIESFSIKEEGYHPFLIKEGWQMAQLNYTDSQHISQITQLDVHRKTDEVFVLLEGRAVLIVAAIKDSIPHFEIELMEANKVYNIPKDVWHNIAMEQGSEVIIAEKSDTHLSDFEHLPLEENQRKELHHLVTSLFDSINTMNGRL